MHKVIKCSTFWGIFLILCSFNLSGQSVLEQDFEDGVVFSKPDNRHINISFTTSDIIYGSKVVHQQEFFTLDIPGFMHSEAPGRPEVPVFTTTIDITGKEITSIKISDVKSKRIYPGSDGYPGQLYPSQPSFSKNENPQDQPFTQDTEFYRNNVPSIVDTVTIEKLGIIRGQTLAQILINPVIYYPASNYFDLITSMEVEIETKESTLTTKVSNTVYSSKGIVSKGISDYDENDITPSFSLSPAGLIVLSDTLMKDFLKPLIEWKRIKGFKVTELYVGENGLERNFISIKDTLDAIWALADEDNPHPDFLIIGGDLDIIPESEGASDLSDMYYSEFDGNGDYLPDMYTGRLPASDTTQMKAIVEKILQYELFEFGDSITHFEKTMLLAGYDVPNSHYMDGQHNYANNNYLNASNNITNYLFLHESDNALRTQYYDSAQVLFDSGIGFVNYTGHGSPSEWLSTGIDYQFPESLSNQRRYPIIISNACQTADFLFPETNMASTFVNAAGKGALAFIGCTVNSYWKEDFWWAVGLSAISDNPDYASSELGFYDRLFHTHNEQPSDWFTSLGQIMYAGNLAVLSSTSSLKQIYWEYYTLLGDPSIIPYLGTPSEFNIEVPDSIPLALSELTISADAFSYAALSHFDTLWDASALDLSGSASLTIPMVQKDSCLLVITGQNKIPFIKTLYFTEPDTAWLDILSITPTDMLGNANDTADYGETLQLDVDIQNVGLDAATDVFMRLSTENEYITISGLDSVLIGTIAQMSEVNLIDNYNIVIADSIADKTNARFTLKVYYGPNIIEKVFDIKLHAPVPSILSYITDDTSLGNGNMRPEPGETIDIKISVTNLGSSSMSGILSLSDISPYISFGDIDHDTGLLQPGDTVSFTFTGSLDGSTPDGELISFKVLLLCAQYETESDFYFVAGGSIEDFETANFLSFPWNNDEVFPWIISESDAHNNVYSAISGLTNFDDNQVSSLKMMVNTPEEGNLSFWYRVSSERWEADTITFGDRFFFSINDSIIILDSGETPWTKAEYTLDKGVHMLEWKYVKDPNSYSGSDRVWIDMIRFPNVSFTQSDVAVDSLISPSEPTKEYANEQIIARVVNLGRDTIYTLSLNYQINTANPVNELFSVEIFPGKNTTINFFQTADLTNEGEYIVKVYSSAADDYNHNDTVQLKVVSTDIFDVITNSDDFTIGPVPFRTSTFITSHIALSKADFSLFDSKGMKLWSQRTQSVIIGERLEIRGDGLASGIYILKIDCDIGSYIYRIVKN